MKHNEMKPCKYEKNKNTGKLRIVDTGLTIRPHVLIHVTEYVIHCNTLREKTS